MALDGVMGWDVLAQQPKCCLHFCRHLRVEELKEEKEDWQMFSESSFQQGGFENVIHREWRALLPFRGRR